MVSFFSSDNAKVPAKERFSRARSKGVSPPVLIKLGFAPYLSNNDTCSEVPKMLQSAEEFPHSYPCRLGRRCLVIGLLISMEFPFSQGNAEVCDPRYHVCIMEDFAL